MSEKKYKVIKAYTSYYFRFPLVLPVGTIVTFWSERGFYVSEAVGGYCAKVEKWAVEAWSNYFEAVE